MALTFHTTDHNDHTELRLSGVLDAMTAPELLPTIEQLVDGRARRIVVNIEALHAIDSSGVAAIVGLYKRTRALGGRLTVSGARDQPAQIFRLLRMDRVFLR